MKPSSSDLTPWMISACLYQVCRPFSYRCGFSWPGHKFGDTIKCLVILCDLTTEHVRICQDVMMGINQLLVSAESTYTFLMTEQMERQEEPKSGYIHFRNCRIWCFKMVEKSWLECSTSDALQGGTGSFDSADWLIEMRAGDEGDASVIMS